LTVDPNTAEVANLYGRNDLRAAGGGTYALLSGCPLCEATSTPLPAPPFGYPGFAPFLAGASSDFSHVIFESQWQLTADAPAGVTSLYEATPSGVRLAGILPNGSAAASSIAGQGAGSGGIPRYTPHTISTDGSKVFFTDNSVGFNGSDGNLYMRTGGVTTDQLNASERTDCADQSPCTGTPEPDPSGARPAFYWNAAADGARVFFSTAEALTDNAKADGSGNLYVYDTTKPADDPHNLRLISVDHHPDDGADMNRTLAGVLGTSNDGRYVYFTTSGQLVSNGPTLGTDIGIYLWHDDGTPDGTTTYIGRLTDTTDRNDLYPNLNQQFGPDQARVTPDGKTLLFSTHDGHGLLSSHGGTDYQHSSTCDTGNGFNGECRELYVYRADSDTLRCVSCNPSGAPGTAEASDMSRANRAGSTDISHLSHALTDGGTRVFFNTAEALVPQDVNGKIDVYEYDVLTGTPHLISSGIDPSDSYFLDASASGDDVFFTTRARLVGWDTDQSYDVYDAREPAPGHPAGFPEPSPTPVCSGDGCRAPTAPTAGMAATGSETFQGAGNVPNPPHESHKKHPKTVKCRKGLVRKKVKHGKLKCVRRASAHARRVTHGKGVAR
jgi:hypothetical protein